MNLYINKTKVFLEKIDQKRDQILFIFLKKFWPKKIIPNYITYVRLIIGMALFVLLFYFNFRDKGLIVTMFFIGIISDLLDGSVARCFKMETKFGSLLDSISDRMLILPIAIFVLIENHRWLLFILLVLEVANGLASAYLKTKEHSKPEEESNIFAKTKMVFQSIVFAGILIYWPKPPGLFFVDLLWLSVIFFILSIFLKLVHINFPKLNKQIKIKKS